jgi:hypothetical protein
MSVVVVDGSSFLKAFRKAEKTFIYLSSFHWHHLFVTALCLTALCLTALCLTALCLVL